MRPWPRASINRRYSLGPAGMANRTVATPLASVSRFGLKYSEGGVADAGRGELSLSSNFFSASLSAEASLGFSPPDGLLAAMPPATGPPAPASPALALSGAAAGAGEGKLVCGADTAGTLAVPKSGLGAAFAASESVMVTGAFPSAA